ncbi:MAG: hypothetical protein JOZ54_23560 [Acidobacteria bacterium]|nr:hypothetical protein [Acidobacteriota bacterium]
MRQIAMSVQVENGKVTFSFGEPVSILTVDVTDPSERMMWQVIADDFQEVEVGSGIEVGLAQSWSIDEAPPALLALLQQVEESAQRELEEHGPSQPLNTVVEYGVVPPGYREKAPAAPLTPGEYAVLVFAEQGSASARFTL